jgi:hypothetical protein
VFDYQVPFAGGSFEHRSDNCLEHGDNVPFAKPYKSSVKHQCVACLLEVAQCLAAKQIVRCEIINGK